MDSQKKYIKSICIGTLLGLLSFAIVIWFIQQVHFVQSYIQLAFFLFCNILVFITIVMMFNKMTISNLHKLILTISYITLVLIALLIRVPGMSFTEYMKLWIYHREVIGGRMNLNPLDIFSNVTISQLFFHIMNVLLFVPAYGCLSWLIKKDNSTLKFIIFICTVCILELLQFVFGLGSFDINDIVFYCIGYIVGKQIFDKLVSLENKKAIKFN